MRHPKLFAKKYQKGYTPSVMSKTAVIKTGGKQYVVKEGDVLNVEKLIVDKTVTFDEVLLVDDAGKTTLGTPMVKGTKVTADVLEQGRAAKVIVIKYRAKSRYFKKNGHRQPFTKVKITKIG